MTFNPELLLNLIKWAEQEETFLATHPEFQGKWNQEVWGKKTSCGTAYCIAGQAAVQTGHRLIHPNSSDGSAYSCVPQYIAEQADGKTKWEDLPGVRPRDIATVAAEALGIDCLEADSLFEASNTIGNLKFLVNRMFRDRYLPAPYAESEVEATFD